MSSRVVLRQQNLAAMARRGDAGGAVHVHTHVGLAVRPMSGSPVCSPMRTATALPCGQGCAANVALGGDDAVNRVDGARGKAAKKASP